MPRKTNGIPTSHASMFAGSQSQGALDVVAEHERLGPGQHRADEEAEPRRREEHDLLRGLGHRRRRRRRPPAGP